MNTATDAAEAAPLSQTPVASRACTCPKCSSPDVAKARVLYERGTTVHNMTTGTIGVGAAGLGVAQSNTTGRSHTETAVGTAPPAPPSTIMMYRFLGIVLALLVGVIGLGIVFANVVVGLAVMGFGGWLGVRGWQATADGLRKYPKALAEYERKWSCLRCGHLGDEAEFKPA